MAKFLDQKMLTGFVREAQSYLPQIREGVTQFQQDATQREALDEALRYAHTIKGAASMVSLPVLSHLAYYVEETLEEVVAGQRPLDAPCHAWVHRVTEQLGHYLEQLLAGDTEPQALVTEVVQTFRRFKGLPNTGDAAAIREAMVGFIDVTPAPAEPEVVTPAMAKTASSHETVSAVAPAEPVQEDEFSIDLLSDTVAVEAAALAAMPEDLASTIDMAMVSQDLPAFYAEDEPTTEVLHPAAVTLDALVGSIDRDVHQVYSQGIVPKSPSGRLDSQNQADRYILFTLAGSRYAVPVPHVIEIGRIPRITPVPNVPAWMRGVINLRGEILSVIDFRTFLGLEEMHHDAHSRMLVVKTPGDEIATSLIVDQIMGIVPLANTRLEIPATSNNKAAPYLAGAYEHEEQVCAVFDLERLLLSPEVRQFE